MKLFIAIVAIVTILAVAIGVTGIVYGESDDSPGLQLLGVVIVIGAVVFGVRTARHSR